MITFDCPHCGYSIKVQVSLAGRKGKCAGCGKQVTVPAAGLLDQAAPSIEEAGNFGSWAPADAIPPAEGASEAAFDDVLADLGITDAPLATPPLISSKHVGLPGAAGPRGLSRSPTNLQPCQDCGEPVSIHARVCPRCGCPIRDSEPVAIVPPWATVGFERSTWSYVSALVGTIGFLYFAFWFDTTVAEGQGIYAHRVHNVGLMNDRLVGVIAFAVISLRTWFPDRLKFEKAP